MVRRSALLEGIVFRLTYSRHGKPIQRYGWVPFHHPRAWRHCDHRLLGHRPNLDLTHPILLPLESFLGIQASRMVSSAHASFVDSGVCAGLVRRRSGEKLDQPSPWNWPGNLCHGYFSGVVGVVGTQEGEEKDAASCSLEAGGKLCTETVFC